MQKICFRSTEVTTVGSIGLLCIKNKFEKLVPVDRGYDRWFDCQQLSIALPVDMLESVLIPEKDMI